MKQETPTLEEFDAFLTSEMLPKLAEERSKENAGPKAPPRPPINKWAIVGFGALGVVAAIYTGIYHLAFFGFLYPLRNHFRGSDVTRYRCDTQNEFYIPTMRFLGVETRPNGWMNGAEFRRLKLFDEDCDRVASTNGIEGVWEGAHYRFCHLGLLKVRQSKNSNGTTRETVKSIWAGVILEAECNKEFSGTVHVLTDKSETWFGEGIASTIQKFQCGGRGELVRLEDPKFEQRFKVYATDDVEARYLLSPSFMERVLEIEETYGAKARLCFMDGKVTLALEGRFDVFPVPWNARSIDENTFHFWNNGLARVHLWLSDLGLDVRVWSKSA